MTYPPLHITHYWSDVTDQLAELVDLFSEEQLDWRPAAKEWSSRTIILHIVAARDHWMANAVHDGGPTPRYMQGGETKDGLKQQLRLSWERLERFLSDPAKLAERYGPPPGDPVQYLDPPVFDGHWIAYHRLAHDIHHRADVLRYIAQLGIEVPAGRWRRPL